MFYFSKSHLFKYNFSLSVIATVLEKNVRRIGKTKLREVITAIINRCTKFNLQQELVWTLWIAKKLKVFLKLDTIDDVIKNGCDLAIIIALDVLDLDNYYPPKRLESTINSLRQEMQDYSQGSKDIKDDILYSEHWLLAYECELHGWLNSKEEKFHCVEKNPFFKKMLKAGIDFYDSQYDFAKAVRSRDLAFIQISQFMEAISNLRFNVAFS